MADISEYLDIIANEPKGRLVKQAIYDALNAINQQAEIRPPAKREITIGEVLGDTGYLLDYEIGEITQGSIGYQYDIRNSTLSSGEVNLATSSAIYASSTGLAFVVAVNDWDENDVPTITDASTNTLSWTPLASTKATMKIGDGGDGSQIYEDLPTGITKFNFKGMITSRSDLPETGVNGDTYVLKEGAHPAGVSLEYYVYNTNYVSLITGNWGAYDAAEFERTVEKRITVWVSEIGAAQAPTGISVTVASYDSPVTIGAFYIGDTDTRTVSTLPYHVRLIDGDGFHGVKAFDESKTYKGRVANTNSLPRPGDAGDVYYVISNDNFAIWNATESDYDYDPAMYLSYSDYVNEGQASGVSEGTYKIYVVFSLEALSDFASPLVMPSSWSSQAEKASCLTGEACGMTAWLQMPTGGQVPYSYIHGRELYRWAYNGSVAIIPIEIGEREEPDDDQTD